MSTRRLIIGIDAGGTATKLLARSSETLADVQLEGPGANLQRRGLDDTAEVLATLITEATQQFPDTSLDAVCAGVAGAGRPQDQHQLQQKLASKLKLASTQLLVVDDARIALEAAFLGGSGLILIVGTGSMALARSPDGTMQRSGGWGYLLGDTASGYALGRQALAAVAEAMDGGPATRIQQLLEERENIVTPADLIRRVYHDRWPLQRASSLLLAAAEAGDEVAQTILTTQTEHLSIEVANLARHSTNLEPRIALHGGMFNAPLYRTTLSSALQNHLPDWLIEASTRPAVEGALFLTIEKARGTWPTIVWPAPRAEHD